MANYSVPRWCGSLPQLLDDFNFEVRAEERVNPVRQPARAQPATTTKREAQKRPRRWSKLAKTVGNIPRTRSLHIYVPVCLLFLRPVYPPSLARDKSQESGADSSTDTNYRHHPDRRAAVGSNDGSSQYAAQQKRQGLPAAARGADKRSLRRSSGSGGGGGGGSAKRRPNRVLQGREAELLPAVYARLDSGDWRERLKGLEEVG